MKKDRIPEQVLPGNYYDGEVLYGNEMNKIVNVLRTGVNANKNDIDNLILDVEKHASIINLGEIDFSELDDLEQVGIYKFSVRGSDESVNNYLLFQTFDGNRYTQTIYNGTSIRVRSIVNGNWSYWGNINLSDINSNKSSIYNIQDNLYSVENKVNKNTDDISDLNNHLDLIENKVNKNIDDIGDLNYSLYVVNVKVDDNITETNKKLDKETYQEQVVRSPVNFRGGIETNLITSPLFILTIGSHAIVGFNADKEVHAGEYYEGFGKSDDNRLATRKYVMDRFAELVGGSPEALDTIYELAEALKNNPDVIDELLNEIAKVDQKADAHIADVNNPHEVTAEQVGTYDKTAIDLKDADVLQEAKSYTYSKVEIDNKDADALQEAKDFTYSKSVIDAKDASTLQTAKEYTDDRISEEITAEKVKQLYEANPNTNAFTDAEKAKLAGIEAGAEVNKVNSVNGKVGVVVLSQDDIGDGASYKRVSQAEKDAWNNKQDKLIAGNNITIDPSTNVISASGNAVGVIETRANVLTKIWTGTQAQYDAIETKDANTLYFII